VTKEQFSLVKKNLDAIIELQTKIKHSLEQLEIDEDEDSKSVIESKIDSIRDEMKWWKERIEKVENNRPAGSISDIEDELEPLVSELSKVKNEQLDWKTPDHHYRKKNDKIQSLRKKWEVDAPDAKGTTYYSALVIGIVLGIGIGLGGFATAEFDCENGESIWWGKKSDGNLDCSDGSDESVKLPSDGGPMDWTLVIWIFVVPGSISLAAHYLGIRFQLKATAKNQISFQNDQKYINDEFNKMYKKGIDDYRSIERQIGQLRKKIGMIDAANDEIGKGLKFQERSEEKIIQLRAEIAAVEAQKVKAEKEREAMEEKILQKFTEIREFIPFSEYVELSV